MNNGKVRRGKKLSREFYTRGDTLLVARELLGKRLVVPSQGARVSGIIVETEAYLGPEDKAAHSFNHRRTPRTEVMYERGGAAYVFFIYGMYYQFNVVVNRAEIPHAVLVRAVEPEEGVELMRARRLAVRRDRDLTNGPGKLCQAFSIDRTLNGEDLRGGRVWLEDAGYQVPGQLVSSGPRVGIDYAEEFVDKHWRFWIKDNPYVSRKR
jgi:DNA-3-methyladenine glycosylase